MYLFCFVFYLELEQLRDHFQLLSSLPATTRSSLLQQITQVMVDRLALASLQSVVRQHKVVVSTNCYFCSAFLKFTFLYLSCPQLERMCVDETPVVEDDTTTDSPNQSVRAILDLLEQSGQVDSRRALSAFHLITSAMDGGKARLYSNLCLNASPE